LFTDIERIAEVEPHPILEAMPHRQLHADETRDFGYHQTAIDENAAEPPAPGVGVVGMDRARIARQHREGRHLLRRNDETEADSLAEERWRLRPRFQRGAAHSFVLTSAASSPTFFRPLISADENFTPSSFSSETMSRICDRL